LKLREGINVGATGSLSVSLRNGGGKRVHGLGGRRLRDGSRSPAPLCGVHWLAEVAAVAARLTPQTVVRDIEMLTALEFPTTDDPNVMRWATNAVALENEDALLVTADDRYHMKAERYGMIAALRDWGSVP
jgi:hypothetical protein